MGKIRDLHEIVAGAHLVALLHGNCVHAAVKVRRDGFAVVHAHQFIALLHIVACGHIHAAHLAGGGRGVAGAVDEVQISAEAQGIGNGADAGGVAVIGDGVFLFECAVAVKTDAGDHQQRDQREYDFAQDSAFAGSFGFAVHAIYFLSSGIAPILKPQP